MKKAISAFISIFILCHFCISQDYIIIDHVGGSDKYIPALVIKKEKISQKVFDSDSSYNELIFRVIIELNKEKYEVSKSLIYKNALLENTFSNLGFRTFRIQIVKGNMRNIYFISSLKSVEFFTELLNKVKDKRIDDRLTLNLGTILSSIQ